VRSKERGDLGEVGCISEVYEALRDCPSLHIIGDRDPIKRVSLSPLWIGLLCWHQPYPTPSQP
jgi:hypothetical protein